MSKESILKLRTKYSNNCTLLGELATQRAGLEARITQLANENIALTNEFNALAQMMKDAEAAVKAEAAAAVKKEEVDGTQK